MFLSQTIFRCFWPHLSTELIYVNLLFQAVKIDASEVTVWYKMGTVAKKLHNYPLAKLAFEQVGDRMWCRRQEPWRMSVAFNSNNFTIVSLARNDCLVGLVVKASASRAEDPGFESCLRRDFFGVESYQWLENWHSSGYPARRLSL